ncbi:MAG: PHP domain-containing protein [Armatimonadetes bacterium]|nr:PHP domain-containing protein [Armatimonadota bacterium]
MARVDLHLHSTASDGQLSPAEVVARAASREVTVVALCDHDTVAGYAEALAAGETCGVRVVLGVELTCWDSGRSVHLLGYGCQPDHPALSSAMAQRTAFRQRHLSRLTARLTELGLPISMEQVAALAGADSIGRPHLAAAMVEAGHVPDVKAAFDQYLRRNRPAYLLPDQELPVREACEAVRAAGGLAVLAHPALDRAWQRLGEYASYLDGLEVYHPAHTPELVRQFSADAVRHNLLLTGGSDNHGPQRPPDIGEVELPAEQWERLAAALSDVGRTDPS